MIPRPNQLPPFRQNPLPDQRYVPQHQHVHPQNTVLNLQFTPDPNPNPNPKPLSYSQSKPQANSNYAVRPRVNSLPEPSKPYLVQQRSSRQINWVKLKLRPLQLKNSNGIINQPPDYISQKYTFKKAPDTPRINQNGACFFGSCCSMIKQTQRQVYLSPSQLISIGYFYKNTKPEAKSLKIQKNVGCVQQVQKSFFKDTSNVIE